VNSAPAAAEVQDPSDVILANAAVLEDLERTAAKDARLTHRLDSARADPGTLEVLRWQGRRLQPGYLTFAREELDPCGVAESQRSLKPQRRG
jgi:hypothetical protein